MVPARPDPEAMLARVREESERAVRAKLKIFFGASAGVGKTFAMLVEAHERQRAGTDVVVGVVETHGRRETGALLEGLELLPRRRVEHRGVTLEEFDLDRARERRPGLLLLDELAHTNAPGSRHAKRWQDVEELLAAGVDVSTTLNVQHVESLVDVVAQITGVTVRETVPDSILDRADEVELVDLPPDDLLQRLREGKVYVPHSAERALENFFRKGNLIALRELALRQTAQRVDAQMESYRRTAGIAEPWAVRERILVCLGEPESGLRLVRSARRMVAALKAEWIVAHVETPGDAGALRVNRDRIVDVMGLAEDLGAEVCMLTGLRVADEILAFARARNVSRIVVGKPRRPRWREWLSPSLVHVLVSASGDLDVHVLRGEDAGAAPARPAPPAPGAWRGYAGTLPVVLVVTALCWLVRDVFELSNLAMIYLLGVIVSAMAFGRGPAIFASVLSVAAFDFLFVPPRFTFAVSDGQYVVTFAVMLAVALVIGTLAARMREQTEAARAREQRAASLHQLSAQLAGRRSVGELLAAATGWARDALEGRVVMLRPAEGGGLRAVAGDAKLLDGGGHEEGVARWAFDHGREAGLGTDTLPGARGLYVPLVASGPPLAVLALQPADPGRLRDPDRQRLLRTFAAQTAVALERGLLAEEAERARVEAETERARSALLSSVSHDLRTPLAAITGAATSLRDDPGTLAPAARTELSDTIVEEAQRLGRLVGDLLDMTRLESGALQPRSDWQSVEELVGATLARLEARLADRSLEVRVPADLPLVRLDDVLMGQVLYNLLDNALRYTPAGSPLSVTASVGDGALRLEVGDRGSGLAPGEERRVFEKFYRGRTDRGGTGLGLAICRGIVEAHGGRIEALPRPGGGALFRITLPLGGEPPAAVPEAEEA